MNLLSSWQKAPLHPSLREGELHVWRIPLSGNDSKILALARDVLDEDERHRAERLIHDPARMRYTLSHFSLRNILSLYLNTSPSSLLFQQGPHGKPSLVNHNLKFNLSHSGNMALVGVAMKSDVGIDIEVINKRHSTDEIVERFFSPAEQKAYLSYPPSERLHAFFRCWSRKEAVIKALGEGLACPLSGFDVSLDVHHAQLLATRREIPSANLWNMITIEAHPDYAAAAAVIGTLIKFDGFDYETGRFGR